MRKRNRSKTPAETLRSARLPARAFKCLTETMLLNAVLVLGTYDDLIVVCVWFCVVEQCELSAETSAQSKPRSFVLRV